MSNQMLSGAEIVQQRIWAGMARAAGRVGSDFTLYRPAGTGPVLAPANSRGVLRAQFGPLGGFARANLYGSATRQLLADGAVLLPGDYLSDGTRTAFVASREPLLPILAIACNRTVTLSRAAGDSGRADAGYGGDPAAATVVLDGWPASLLAGGGPGAAAPARLPSDPVGGGWTLLLPPAPALAGLVIAGGDRVRCDLGRRYAVSGAELSGLGWRMTLGEIGI